MNRKPVLTALAALLLASGAVYAAPPTAATKPATMAPAAATAVAAAHHFIWSVSKNRAHIYLVGSIHTLNPNDYPLPDIMENAFLSSDALVEEVDLTMLDTDTLRQEASRMGTFPKGESLQKILPPDLYTELTASAQSLGLDMQDLDRDRPWFASTVILAAQLRQDYFNPSDGVDNHFADEAQILEKPVIGLETAHAQLDLMASLPAKSQLALLKNSIEESAHFTTDVSALIAAWKNGDADGLNKIMHKDFSDDPIAYQRLIVDRNRAWFPRLERLAASGRQYFVVVGAAHLVGPDGLLASFSKARYKVTQL